MAVGPTGIPLFAIDIAGGFGLLSVAISTLPILRGWQWRGISSFSSFLPDSSTQRDKALSYECQPTMAGHSHLFLDEGRGSTHAAMGNFEHAMVGQILKNIPPNLTDPTQPDRPDCPDRPDTTQTDRTTRPTRPTPIF